MPYNPAGLFSLIASYFATPGATIRTEQHNPVFEDVASALSSVLLRDGRAPMTGPLNMNGFPINNVVAGSSPSSVATLAQAMPIGAVIDFAGAVAPSGWALCYGQAISRATYATLFALVGTTFGAGDGSTTFNLPDLRGRVTAAPDNMGGVQAGRLNSGAMAAVANNVGGAGGTSTSTLTTPNLPPYTPAGSITNGAITAQFVIDGNSGLPAKAGWQLGTGDSGAGAQFPNTQGTSGNLGAFFSQAASGFSGTSQGGTSTAVNITQPTMILPKIIRISYDG